MTTHPARPMHVLMTIDAVGGVWRYAVDLARSLREVSVSTVLVGLGPRPDAVQATEARACADLRWLEAPLDWIAQGEQGFAPAAALLERIAREEGADLLHLNLPSLAAGIDQRWPVVVVSHSCVVTWWRAMRAGPLPADWEWQKRRNAVGFARADAIVTPTRSQADLLRACYLALPPVEVVPNASAATFPPVEKRPFALAAGRWWDEGKGGLVLDAAAARVKWPVMMAGPQTGPAGQRLDIRNAEALGPINHRRLLDFAGTAGIVVSPSLYEPFGLSALEGARAGAALVLSDIPTYRELWAGAATFVPAGDADALASAINRLADDPQARSDLGQRAHARSLGFSPRLQTENMRDIYLDALSQARRPLAVGA